MTVTVGSDGGWPIMSAARDIAGGTTQEISQADLDAIRITLPSTFDPLDDLVGRVRGRARGAVDALQVAALLEADGANDRAARVEYGFGDVFELADAVYRRLGGPVQHLRPVRAPLPDRARSVRDVSHGLLYLLPCVLFPAALAVVTPRALVVSLVLAGGLGWVWAGGTAWLAFTVLGLGDQRAAGRLLAWASLVGVLVAAWVGATLTLTLSGGRSVAILVPGVMAYQMAATVLTFYRREWWLAALIAPAVVVGLLYLTLGRGLLVPALAVMAICVLIAFTAAITRALRAGGAVVTDRPVRLRTALRGRTGTFVAVLGYASLSAAFLLHAQARYLVTQLDVVVVGAALIAAMGVVEWRARRFDAQARLLLERVRYPREFVPRVWAVLLANVVVCWLAVGVGAFGVLGGLAWLGLLSPAGVVMAGAQVGLAGAYFLAFVLAGHNRYGWLCAAIGGALAVHLGGGLAIEAAAGPLTPLTDTALFLGCTVLLQILLVAALAPVVGQVRRYR